MRCQFSGWMIVFVSTLFLVGIVRAEDTERATAKPASPLPRDPALWMNSTPISLSHLQGKGAYLLFLDIEFPEAKEEIAAHLASAKLHAMDPVIYILVARAKKRDAVDSFVKAMDVTWPVLFDPYYEYSKACDALITQGADVVSLAESNYNTTYLTADSRIVRGWGDEPETTAREALIDAKWTIDPKDIPQALWPLWRDVEFKKYSQAAAGLKKAVAIGSPEQQKSAKVLADFVTAEMERRLTAAQEADDANHKWAAYESLLQVQEDFRGYELPKEASALQKKLARNSQVKDGLVAEKQLAAAEANLKSPNLAVRKRTEATIQKIMTDFPETNLALRAEQMLKPKGTPK